MEPMQFYCFQIWEILMEFWNYRIFTRPFNSYRDGGKRGENTIDIIDTINWSQFS
jgi:hypothetical protein